ncbi:MAG: 50S ribosomal protein L4 [Parcubacteria group bacterium]|nr:50S ribosomal protein L4 [Parcubacteria group bacterium]
MNATIYNQTGKEVGTVSLPEAVFGVKWNADLVHQAVVAMEANARTPVAHAKDRGDVRGGGKKPWKQKGTGRARHGSTRSPIWVGGGVAHGPTNEKIFAKKLNKKMRTKALYSALSQKLRDKEILFVDAISFSAPKTKAAQSMLKTLSVVAEMPGLVKKTKNAALLAMNGESRDTQKSFQNLPNVGMSALQDINPMEVLRYKYLIITNPESSIAFLAKKSL